MLHPKCRETCWVESFTGMLVYPDHTPIDILSSVVFICFLTVCLTKIQFTNPLLKQVGKISYETYLVHHLTIAFLPMKNDIIFTILCFFGSLLLGFLFHLICTKLKCLFM